MIRSVLFILGLSIVSCLGTQKASSDKLSMKQMNYPTYDAQWKEVQDLENDGKTKSANEKVESIYQLAKQEENTPQIYKSLIHLSKYTQILEEDSELTIVNRFQDEIDQAELPTKQLLQSALAELYWQYYQNNRYRFLDRTSSTGGIDNNDFRTWDLDRILTETDSLYSASLLPKEKLATYEIKEFSAILQGLKEEYIPLRPSLYGFLTHRAIDFYQNDESSVIKPSNQFEIREIQAFAPRKSFLEYQPKTNHSQSHRLKTIQLYQELLENYSLMEQTAALIHTDLQRLKFVKNNARVSNKDDLYEAALKRLYQEFKNEDQVAMVGYEIALHYKNQGNQYQSNQLELPGDVDSNQWKLKEAISFANEVIATYPESLGAQNAKALIHQIEAIDVSLTVEENIVPHQPTKMLVDYKNVDQLYFKVAKIDYQQLIAFQGWKFERKQQFLSQLEGQHNTSSTTPNVGDYQNHSYEFLLNENGFEPGMYVIVASTDAAFSADGILKHAVFQSTNLSYLTQSKTNAQAIYVAYRSSGKPIANANIQVTDVRNKRNFKRSAITDSKGQALLSINESIYYSLLLTVEANGETAYFNHSYNRQYTREKRWNNRAFLFTDRSIFRPGQSVYFKAIALRTNGEESKIEANQNVTVKLIDANGEQIEQLSLQTNEYGSVQSSFTIPQGRLLGIYRIEVEGYGSTRFSVEEYKRPRFQVEMQPLEGSYVVNETVNAQGKAMAYAGASISNATVQYRVTRVVRWPYYWWAWRNPIGGTEQMEVAFGETTTDANGNFTIPFQAIPDESVNKENFPVFDYQIQVDVTDVNGETRSSSQTVSVGYTSLSLGIEIDQPTQKPKDVAWKVTTKNLNGQPLATNGNLSIYKLIAPDRVVGTRKWKLPDQNPTDGAVDSQLFPHEAFSEKEENPNQWENGEQVFDKTFATDSSGLSTFSMNSSALAPGHYRMVAKTKDAFGNDIQQETLFYLQGTIQEPVADHQLITFSLNQEQFEPGEQAVATFGSAAENLWVWVEVQRDEQTILKELLHLQDNKQQINIPIQEKDRGGLSISYGAIKFNQQYSQSRIIAVPWTNKQLSIEVESFRDKLDPGSEETWTFTVKGHQGEKVAAEFLTAMYDASLDQFKGHSWSANAIGRSQSYSLRFSSRDFGITSFRDYGSYRYAYHNTKFPRFPRLNLFGFSMGANQMLFAAYAGAPELEAVAMEAPAPRALQRQKRAESNMDVVADNVSEEDSIDSASEEKSLDIVARKNLQETAYFFPQLSTDADGNVKFSFTTPEALTEWKVMALAHTKDLHFGQWEGSTITQKELMVIANPPRFFREGDKITFSTKIANVSDRLLTGRAELQLLDATTMQPVYNQFGTAKAQQPFSVEQGGNTSVEWNLTIPENVPAVTYRVLAKAGNFSDGEENALPILSNRKLVTESMPIALRSNQTKRFVLDKLANNKSSTLKHHKLTLEMTSNPAWYGVQALPYLMEFPYECAEQTFARYYANSLASHVANSNPRIQSVFDTWRSIQPDALTSNLNKNQELKELILRETPWVRDANDESEQKRRIGLLFDMNRMAAEREKELHQLQQLQMSSGGWPWFAGGRENRFITQHIVAGLGHLDALNVNEVRQPKSWDMTKKAIRFLDDELTRQLNQLKRYNNDWQDIQDVGYIVVHYFYVRSFFQDVPVSKRNQEAFDFYFNKLKEDWLSEQIYRNGLAALAFHRYNEKDLAQKIVTALRENSITSEELGMYWKSNTPSWWWYQAPIETQALMIEVFDEVAKNQAEVDELKVWLLKNKQTNRWETTKATSEAVYALLMTGGEWLAVDDLVEVSVGGNKIDPNQLDGVQPEAGTGYFKTNWSGGEIKPEMATVEAKKKGEGIAWGALYWQYFEDLDQITSHDTPLQLHKQLFLQENTATGPKISSVKEGQRLEIGDLVKVRIELRVDRDMEFVHMKDMRAAGFEPLNVLSQYKWQDGLGYYESTKDASTDFFFEVLPKGVYVFEYPLRVNNRGDFSNGITTIQCMYAPEFTSHSEGVRVVVE